VKACGGTRCARTLEGVTRTHFGLAAIGLAALGLSIVGSVPTAAQTVAPPASDVVTPTDAVTPTDVVTPTATAAPTDAPTPVAAQPAQAPDFSIAPDTDVRSQEHAEDRGADNIVEVQNLVDNQFRMRGSVDLDHVAGDTATPTNRAEAYASCINCQTFAVALQIALIRSDASTVAPVNQAISINNQCTGCFTSARALQYVFVVDDPQQIPGRANQFISRMNAELRDIARTPDMTPREANARIDAVIGQFSDLALNLKDARRDSDQPDQDNDSGPS
jgi:hypothetical protein